MNEEGKFWATFVVIICLSICLFASSMCYFSVKESVEMAKLGYEQVSVVGRVAPIWQKAK